MRALFGEGLHPDAERTKQEMLAAGADPKAILAAIRLGTPNRIYEGGTAFRRATAAAFTQWNQDYEQTSDGPVPAEVRAETRTRIGRQLFTAEHGRPPADARELSGLLARLSRRATTALAGYDLTFSPVESVSTLWALASPEIAARVRAAHDAAVADTLAWLE